MDPSLDVLGKKQAEDVAQRLQPLGPLAILSSPLARARETAAPLAKFWGREPMIEHAVAEIPSPTDNLDDRITWLRQFMAGSWTSAAASLAAWRQAAITALVSRREDTVIFSHYVALNVAVGAAEGDDRVVVFSPDNCSITVFDIENGMLQVVEKGQEAPLTRVN